MPVGLLIGRQGVTGVVMQPPLDLVYVQGKPRLERANTELHVNDISYNKNE